MTCKNTDQVHQILSEPARWNTWQTHQILCELTRWTTGWIFAHWIWLTIKYFKLTLIIVTIYLQDLRFHVNLAGKHIFCCLVYNRTDSITVIGSSSNNRSWALMLLSLMALSVSITDLFPYEYLKIWRKSHLIPACAVHKGIKSH